MRQGRKSRRNRRIGTSASGGRDVPQIVLIFGYQTSSIYRSVTVNRFVAAGSAVARKPDTTQACAPYQTSSPAGRPVIRTAAAAACTAAVSVGLMLTTYEP